MAQIPKWWQDDSIIINKRTKARVRAISILWIDKSDLICKCGHLGGQHIHSCGGSFGGNYLGRCNARLYTCKCKDFDYAYKWKPKDLLEIGYDLSEKPNNREVNE